MWKIQELCKRWFIQQAKRKCGSSESALLIDLLACCRVLLKDWIANFYPHISLLGRADTQPLQFLTNYYEIILPRAMV